MALKESEFDIFHGNPESGPVWVGAVKGLPAARERMRQIAARKPGSYFLFCTNTRCIVERFDLA